MEDQLAETLENLELRKKIIDTETDLTAECEAILELDHRIGLLLKDIRSLKIGAQEQGGFLEQICDRLKADQKVLSRTSRSFELSAQLIKLNRLCKRIDSNRAFQYPNEQFDQSNRRPSLIAKENGDSCMSESTELASQMISEIVESYETTYEPLEALLANRPDLPYNSYAVKVRRVKAALQERVFHL